MPTLNILIYNCKIRFENGVNWFKGRYAGWAKDPSTTKLLFTFFAKLQI